MVVGIDHIGIAVNKLDEAISLYRDFLGLELEGVHVVNEQKVRVASLSTGGETRIELLEPTESESPITKFIGKRGEGIHHIALKVRNIETVLEELKEKGLMLVDEKPRVGVGGAKIAFIHPKSTRSVLIELCEEPQWQTSMSAKISVNKLQDGLRTKSLGKSIIFSREVDSTNERAKKLATYEAQEGTVVIAETQTRGRGRLDREWVSPAGGLWFSIVLRPKLYPTEAIKLTFVAGLAVAEVLNEMFDLKVETKWPNDVLVNGRKICGILTEMNTTGQTVNFVVVGIGVNADFNVEEVFSEQMRKVATSLEDELGRKVELEELLRSLLEKLETLYGLFRKEGFSAILEKWKNYAYFLGHKVEVVSPTGKLRGSALDIDNEGALLLEFEDGTVKRVVVGDVSLQA